jgi:hypothetical protein
LYQHGASEAVTVLVLIEEGLDPLVHDPVTVVVLEVADLG